MAGTERAEIKDVFALFLEDRLVLVERCLVTASHDIQQPVLGVRRRTTEGRINHAHAFLAEVRADFLGGCWNGRAEIDEDRAILDAF